MVHHASPQTGNRLLAALAPDDYAHLEPMLERVPLTFGSVLFEAGQTISHVIFPEVGAISVLVDTDEGRVEISLIGREGFVGIPVLLGTDRGPYMFVVQAEGVGLRMEAQHLSAAIAERPSIFRPLGLYTQFMMVQIAQTSYVNAMFEISVRLARWLLMLEDRVGSPELAITHNVLSAMLGARRPGVTIATHMLEGTGAIRATRGRIEIRNREKLLELAGDSYSSAEREYERLMAQI